MVDSFPVHFFIESLEFAQLLNILFVRVLHTDIDSFQDLKYRIFGLFKNYSRTFLYFKILKEMVERYGMNYAIKSVAKSINRQSR